MIEILFVGWEGGLIRWDYFDVEDGCFVLVLGKRMGFYFFSLGKCGLWRELERIKKFVLVWLLFFLYCFGWYLWVRGRKNILMLVVICDGCGNFFWCGCWVCLKNMSKFVIVWLWRLLWYNVCFCLVVFFVKFCVWMSKFYYYGFLIRVVNKVYKKELKGLLILCKIFIGMIWIFGLILWYWDDGIDWGEVICGYYDYGFED